MSPSVLATDGSAVVFGVTSNGYLNYWGVNYTIGVRPVINLKSSITFEAGGSGTSSNPYVINVK